MDGFFGELLIVLGIFAFSMCVAICINFLRIYKKPQQKKQSCEKPCIYYIDNYRKSKPRQKRKKISLPLEAVVLKPEEFSKMFNESEK